MKKINIKGVKKMVYEGKFFTSFEIGIFACSLPLQIVHMLTIVFILYKLHSWVCLGYLLSYNMLHHLLQIKLREFET